MSILFTIVCLLTFSETDLIKRENNKVISALLAAKVTKMIPHLYFNITSIVIFIYSKQICFMLLKQSSDQSLLVIFNFARRFINSVHHCLYSYTKTRDGF